MSKQDEHFVFILILFKVTAGPVLQSYRLLLYCNCCMFCKKNSPAYGQVNSSLAVFSLKKSHLFKCSHIVYNGPDVFCFWYFLFIRRHIFTAFKCFVK